MEISVALLVFTVFVLICCNAYLFKRVDNLLDVVARQAVRIGDHESMLLKHDEKIKTDEYNYSDFCGKLEELERKVQDIPVEDLVAAQKAEEAWNEGVQNILSFGLDTMKKGGLNNE